MNILVLQDTDWIKRGPHQQHHLMDRMALRGHQVRVIDYEYLWREEKDRTIVSSRKEIKGAYKIFKESNITLIRPGIIKIPYLDMASVFYFHESEIKRQIREFNPDIIIAISILTAFLGMKQAKKHQIPFIYYSIDHAHELVPNKSLVKIAKQFEKQVFKGADKIFVINQGLKDYAMEMGGSADKISVITAGIDSERFNPQVDGSNVRNKYGIKNDDLLLFFMGWIYDFSGMKEVVESLSITDNQNIKLMIVGEGDLYKPLLKMQSKKNLAERLILTGKIPFEEIPQYIAAANICLLPAYNNKIMMNIVPIKLYEYMALGKPVITTRLLGIMKEFDEGRGIIYVDSPEDVLCKSIELLEKEEIQKHGIEAREFVEGHSWDDVVGEFESLLYRQCKF